MYNIQRSRLVPIDGEHGGWIDYMANLCYVDGSPFTETDAISTLNHVKNLHENTQFYFRLVKVTTKIIA
jgi:hypothetical protein